MRQWLYRTLEGDEEGQPQVPQGYKEVVLDSGVGSI